jgi:hypothetical protein
MLKVELHVAFSIMSTGEDVECTNRDFPKHQPSRSCATVTKLSALSNKVEQPKLNETEHLFPSNAENLGLAAKAPPSLRRMR